MRFIFLISFFCIQNLLFATEVNDIQVSPTFSINIPFKLSSKVDLLSLNSKLYSVSDQKLSNPQILVLHNTPRTLANKFSVERYWQKSRKQTKTSDKKEMDYGCVQKRPRTYQCSRDVGQDGKFIAESIFWNSKSDLVLVRVSSNYSFIDARMILNKIKTVENTRLPAEVSR